MSGLLKSSVDQQEDNGEEGLEDEDEDESKDSDEDDEESSSSSDESDSDESELERPQNKRPKTVTKRKSTESSSDDDIVAPKPAPKVGLLLLADLINDTIGLFLESHTESSRPEQECKRNPGTYFILILRCFVVTAVRLFVERYQPQKAT